MIPAVPGASAPQTKTWSIIIPTLNEEAFIATCLEAICQLDYDLSTVEVLVADNGSSDRTLQIAGTFSHRLDIRILSIPGVSVSALRNSGARAAQGRYLAFVDADCDVCPQWLEAADRILAANVTVTGASYLVPPNAPWPGRVWYWRFDQRRTGAVPFVPAGNMLLARDLFWRIGGFDESLRANEDVEFCARAKRAGATVFADEALSIVHHGCERNLAHFVRRQFWHGSAVMNRSALHANRRAISLAIYTLACTMLLLVSGIFGRVALVSACLCALLLPPVLLALSGPERGRKLHYGPLLVVLVLAYAFARALVLPLAAFRGIHRA